VPAVPPAAKRPRTQKRLLGEVPDHLMENANFDWRSPSQCFICVVDCQPLQAVACGHSPLTATELTDTYEQIAQNIGQLLERNWSPAQLWGDPIIWRPRERNITADYLANYTMDNGASWSKRFRWPFPGWRTEACNFVLHSDGGTRRAQCSASAWALDVGKFADGLWQFERLAMGGTFSATPISSFTAESFALAEGLQYLRSVLTNSDGRNSTVVEQPLGKRRRM